MTVLITKAYSTYGQEVSAGGVISVICDERSIITSGVKVALEGKFSESLFVSNRCLVMNRSLLNSLRERVIVTLEKRIAGTNPTQAGILSMMLLTGRVEDSHARIKTLAQRCGCTHILALSGMHLNTLTLFLKPIKKKGVNYILSVILSLLFVFIAGPRPSLVRALLMLIFRFLPNTERLAVCFIVQLIIFPFSMFNIGCIYSYLAIFALTYLGPLFKSRINILTTFADSASVILLIAPVELITSEAWHPIAIFLGPIAGVLIAFSMFSGILLALSNHLPFLERVNEFTYSSIEKLLATFSGSRNCGWKEYCLYAIICLILILSIPIEQRTRRHRFKKNSKLNIMKL